MKKKRLLEIDVLKGFSIIFMFLVHCYEDYGSYSIQQKGFIPRLIFFLGGPLAAPVFMFCMGVGMVYTSRQSGKDFLKRGTNLFILAYILNFIRDFIPYTIQAIIHHNPTTFEYAKDYLVCTDVLAFAGLAYLFMGLFKLTLLKDHWLIAFYVICAVSYLFLFPIKINNRTLACIAGLLWPAWDCTWFPFLTWIAFPIAGYFFGKRIIQEENTNEFYKKLLTWSGILFLPLLTIMYEFKIDCGALDGLFQMEYFHMNWFGNIIILDVVILWLSFWHFAADNLPTSFKSSLIRWSTNLNFIYLVQWVLIGYGNLVFGYNCHSLIESLLLFLFTLTASDAITTFCSNMTKLHHHLNIAPHLPHLLRHRP